MRASSPARFVSSLGGSPTACPERRFRQGFAVALFVALVGLTPRGRFSQSYDERWGTGDEPRYVRLAASLLHDGDTDVSNADDLVARRFSPARTARGIESAVAAFGRSLEDIVRSVAGRSPEGEARSLGGQVVAGRQGGEYYVYLPGFPLLLAPAVAIDSLVAPNHLWVSLLTCLLLAVGNAFALARLVGIVLGNRLGSLALAIGLVLTPPLFAFGFQLYPEIAASLCLTSFLIVLVDPKPADKASFVFFALAAALMPWLHTKYYPLWAVSMIALVVRFRKDGRGRLALPLSFAFASVGLQALYMFSITGSIVPDALWVLNGYPRGAEIVNAQTLRGLYYLLFGRSEGLLVYAPHYLLAFAGLAALRRSHRFGFWLSLLLLVPYLLIAASHDQGGAGGWSPPARYFVPVIPVLALGLASFLKAGPTSPRVGALLALTSAAFWIGTGMLAERNFLYDRAAYLAAGALDPSPLLGSGSPAEPLARKLAYPLLLVAGLFLLRTAERSRAPAYRFVVPFLLLVVGSGYAALAWAPPGDWTPPRPRSRLVRPGRSSALVVSNCATPGVRLEALERPSELEVSAYGFERKWVAPSREALVVDVGVRRAYRQWRTDKRVDWKLVELRAPPGGDPIRVEAVCREQLPRVPEKRSDPR